MGQLVVVSGPSGAGKTSIVAEARRRRPDLLVSTSATTRPARATEQDGREYHFLTPERFAEMERAGEFLEVAEVHGHRYGTPRAPVERALEGGSNVILEIDVQGAASVRAAMPEAVLVFIRPPSPQALRDRLQGRATDEQAVIEARLEKAYDEIAQAGRFDHQIVNAELDEAVDGLLRILDGNPPPAGGAGRSAGGPQGATT